jgi:hypothetical protein
MDQFERCCHGRKSGCPEVRCSGDYVWIRDDDGNIISMTVVELLDVCTTVVDKLQKELDAE